MTATSRGISERNSYDGALIAGCGQRACQLHITESSSTPRRHSERLVIGVKGLSTQSRSCLGARSITDRRKGE